MLIGWQLYFCLWIGASLVSAWVVAATLLFALIVPTKMKMPAGSHALLVSGCAVFFALFALKGLLFDGGDILLLFGAFAEFLLVVQVIELFRKGRQVSENYLPGLGTLCLVLAILSVESRLRPPDLTWPILVFFVLLLVHMRADLFSFNALKASSQRSRVVVLAVMLVLAIMTGRLFQQELERDIPSMRKALGVLRDESDAARIMVGSTARFVEYVGLDTITRAQIGNPNETVYNVEAARPPGYMRTRSFSFFNGNRWRDPRGGMISKGSLPVESSQFKEALSAQFGFPARFQAFQLRESGRPLDQIKVEIPRGRGSQVPLSINAAVLLAETRASQPARLDSHFNLLPGTIDNATYHLLVDPAPDANIKTRTRSRLTRADDAYLQENLQVPESDLEVLRQFAETILSKFLEDSPVPSNTFPCCPDSKLTSKDARSAKAVAAHFHNNFSYSLSAKPARDLAGRSPVIAFLSERREAHCEYFATATVLLLRSLGIPSRLSTGYLVYEMNDENDYFQATNANAHAWAEYYDSELERWVLVESTPSIPEYVGQFAMSEQIAGLGRSSTSGNSIWQQFWLSSLSFFESIRIVFVRLFTNRYSWLLPMLLIVVYVGYRRFRHSLPGEVNGIRSGEIKDADELASTFGYERAASETCSQFARRLQASDSPATRELGRWYEEFSQVRYQSGISQLPVVPKLSELRTLSG